MSFQPLSEATSGYTQQPEIQHPRPTRLVELQRGVTTPIITEEQQPTARLHCVPAAVALNSEENADFKTEARSPERTEVVHRSSSAPPVFNFSPPTSPTINPILSVSTVLRPRSRTRTRLGWDVRASPDTPSPTVRQNFRCSTSALASATTARILTRLRAKPQPRPTSPASPLGPVCVAGPGAAYSVHPTVLEPAMIPPRGRMLIVCRDLLPWLIPVYARNPDIGCTVLDVMRGIYTALQMPVEMAGHILSGAPATERRRVDWLSNKTSFVCIGRDEALARRRLPGHASLWSEVFVLILARREG